MVFRGLSPGLASGPGLAFASCHQRQVDADGASSVEGIAAKMVPGAYFFRWDAEVLGYGGNRVTAAGAVADGVLGIEIASFSRNNLPGGNGNDELGVELHLVGGEAVGFGDGRPRGAVSAGKTGQGLARSDAVVAPPDAHIFGDSGDGGLEMLLRAYRQVEVEGGVFRGGRAQEAGVEILQGADRGIDAFGDQAKIDGVVDLDGVRDGGGIGNDSLESILGPVLGHDGDGDDDGDVVLGFARQHVAAVELPEVGISGAADGLLHVAGARVVSGHGQIPVPELVVEVVEMVGGGASGLFRVEALINPPIAGEAVAGGAAGDELPHAAGSGAGERQFVEAGFGLSQVDQVLRNAFFLEHTANHGLIASGADEATLQSAFAVLREVVQEGNDRVGQHQRQVGAGGTDFRFGLGFDVGIDGERDFVGFVDRCGLGFLLGETVSLLERGKFEAGSAVDDAIKFALEALVGVDVVRALQQKVEGVVEVQPGSGQVSGLVVSLSGLEFLFRLSDQVSNGVGLGSAWCSLRRSWRLRQRQRREHRSEQTEARPA